MTPPGTNPSDAGDYPPKDNPPRYKFLPGTPLTMSARLTTDLAKLLVRTTDLRSCRNWGHSRAGWDWGGGQTDPSPPPPAPEPPSHQLMVVHHGQLDVLGLAVHRVLGSADLQGEPAAELGWSSRALRGCLGCRERAEPRGGWDAAPSAFQAGTALCKHPRRSVRKATAIKTGRA